VAQASAKPISTMSLTGKTLEPVKVWSAVAATKELLDLSRPGALELFTGELRQAVARATDAVFLSELIATTAPAASAGTSFANLLTDLAALLSAVDLSPTSRVYWIITAAKAKTLALMLVTAGGFAFPQLTVNGGPLIGGVEVLVSDQLPANRFLLIVSDGLVGNIDPLAFRQITEGDIQLNTSPDSPSTAASVLQNMWQHGIAALAVERYLAFEVARTKAVASLSY